MSEENSSASDRTYGRTRLLHILYGGLGGIGTYFMEFVTSDEHSRFEHRAIFYGVEPVYAGYKDFCREHGIPFVEITKRRGPDPLAFARLSKSLQVGGDALIIHSPVAALAALAWRKAFKAPLLHIEHTAAAAKTRRDRFWSRLLRKTADCTVLFYETQREDFHDSTSGPQGEAGRYVVIPKIPDIDFFRPGSKDDGREIRVGMHGRMSKVKDQSTLVRAFAELTKACPSATLHLAGDGDTRPALEVLARQLGVDDRVTFYGQLQRAELLSFLQSLDIYVHATSGETLCYAIMEAQACGLAILASDVCGVREALANGSNGLLFPHTDSIALCSLLEQLARDVDERKRLGGIARNQIVKQAARRPTAEAYYDAIRAASVSLQ